LDERSTEEVEQSCCYLNMPTQVRFAFFFVFAALAAASVLAASAFGASTSEATPGDPTAEEAAPQMSIQFLRRRAVLAGPRALVQVKCAGYEAGSCIGTLALRGPGGAHKVPYSLEHGERRLLAVPLGSDSDAIDPGSEARAVASTLQLTGTSVRTSSTLRLK
jgi:hypothetical protein